NGVQQNYLQRKCREPFVDAAPPVTGALVAVEFISGDGEEAALLPSMIREDMPEPGETGESGERGEPGEPIEPGEPGEPGEAADTEAEFIPPRPAVPAITVADNEGNRNRDRESSQASAVSLDADDMVISPDYSFENFVTGPGNDLAYAAAVAVANNPGTAYNPLFIHGGVGLGKTHLLQAIAQAMLSKTPNRQVCYLSCETFVNQFLDCVQRGQMSHFRHRYRYVDLLVIDDIQFLASRERTQEEFFHTFNALYQSNRQIVLSSDRAPSEIPKLEERLVSRFGWGLVATISRPDYETRVAIVRAKAKVRGLAIPDDVISYIATKIDTNARELEGALTTIQGHAALQSVNIDMTLAQKALGEPDQHAGRSQITLQHIIDAVTGFYNVKLSDLQSKRRHKSITEPRQVCMWLARKRTRFSLEEIGGYFGGRDHTTVMHSIRTVDDRAKLESTFARQLELLEDRITRATDR
ncbi:MAG: chromosomal replication initiator protein DnaA, partial [Phycisphaeraceae bacterium]|nr:chromosomal replication initiator protein DnaA [Phycisphaeraceae bacterium]